MRTNYQINSGVRFNMLSKDQLQSLFDGVLHVLEYTGLDVHHEEAREILQKAGAWVDDIQSADTVIPGKARPGDGTSQLHRLCARWQSRARYSHRSRQGPLWPRADAAQLH